MTLSFLKYEKPALPHQIRWLFILQVREMREGRLNYFTQDPSCQGLSHHSAWSQWVDARKFKRYHQAFYYRLVYISSHVLYPFVNLHAPKG